MIKVSMNNITLSTELSEIFSYSIKTIVDDLNHTFHVMMSDNLTTNITCNYVPYSDHLTEFSTVFNTLLKPSHNNSRITISAFVLENENIFQKIESVFLYDGWLNNSDINKFNLATHDTSKAKCTYENKFYIIKCYDHFYYIYNTESNECLLVVKNEKKAFTMINILLLSPYLSYGDIYAIHGGLVSNGSDNILLTNSSLGGKTTFALLFLENGWKIVTEETTYITKHGQILNYNIRNYFNIRVGTYLEFKDFFVKAGITNDLFLSMSHMSKNELFELGKKEQMLIYFDVLSKNKVNLLNDNINHTLRVSLDKNKSGIKIESSSYEEIVDGFLEISFAPTVDLFRGLLRINNVSKEKIKYGLMYIFRNVKSYSVISGFDYRQNFDSLIQEIKLTTSFCFKHGQSKK